MSKSEETGQKPIDVFVLEYSVPYESTWVLGVFSTAESAIKYAEAYISDDEDKPFNLNRKWKRFDEADGLAVWRSSVTIYNQVHQDDWINLTAEELDQEFKNSSETH